VVAFLVAAFLVAAFLVAAFLVAAFLVAAFLAVGFTGFFTAFFVAFFVAFLAPLEDAAALAFGFDAAFPRFPPEAAREDEVGFPLFADLARAADVRLPFVFGFFWVAMALCGFSVSLVTRLVGATDQHPRSVSHSRDSLNCATPDDYD